MPILDWMGPQGPSGEGVVRTLQIKGISPKVIGRLSLYQRYLSGMKLRGADWVFSRELARHAGVTPSQVRQDIMCVGYHGNAQQGYEVEMLARAIARKLGSTEPMNVILVGAGLYGRAVLQDFRREHPCLELVAAVCADEFHAGGFLQGVPMAGMEELEDLIGRHQVRMAILVVEDKDAQGTAGRLAAAGVRSIVNFTTVRLRLPRGVYVENTDIAVSLERAAFFGSCGQEAGARGESC